MKHRKTFTKFVSLLCLLLLSLLLYGCTERPDAPEIPTTAYEEIKVSRIWSAISRHRIPIRHAC